MSELPTGFYTDDTMCPACSVARRPDNISLSLAAYVLDPIHRERTHRNVKIQRKAKGVVMLQTF